MNHFQSMEGMIHSVAVYVPSTLDVNQSANNAAQVADTLARLSGIFGGCTASDVKGAWISDTSGLIVENVTICKSYASSLGDGELEEVYSIANQIRMDMRQEAVSVEIDGTLYFV
jgi:hypothetical protein